MKERKTERKKAKNEKILYMWTERRRGKDAGRQIEREIHKQETK